MFDAVIRELRFAARTLRRSPGFTAVAVLTFGIGIGVNIAVFSVLDRVLFRALPYDAPDRLVLLRNCPSGPNTCNGAFPSVVAYEAQRLASFEGVAVAGLGAPYGLSREPDGSESVRLSGVSVELLRVLGVQPVLGRDFVEDDAALQRRVALVSYESWQRRFGGTADVVGREVWSRAGPTTVVGVLPEGFIPPSWMAPDAAWEGLFLDSGQGWAVISQSNSMAPPIARLKPAVTIEAARAEVAALVRGLTPVFSADQHNPPTIRIDPLQQTLFSRFRSNFQLIAGAAGLLLLLACANLATLLLAHGRSRERDAAIAAALGGTRARLVGQALLGSLVICLLGSAIAVAVLALASTALVSVLPPLIARYATGATDPRVLAAALLAAAVCAIAGGIAPALRAARVDLLTVLQRASASSRRSRLRGGASLLAMETAFGVVLVLSALLMLSSFSRLASDQVGFEPEGLYYVNALPVARLDPEASLARHQQVLDALREVPGVIAVAGADSVPVAGAAPMWGFATAAGARVGGRFEVTASYFDTVGTSLLAGRSFTEAEVRERAPVAILSAAAARAVWPATSPAEAVGRILMLPDEPALRVIGIVPDVKRQHGADVEAALFVPLGAQPRVYGEALVRTASGAAPEYAAVRQRILERVGSGTVTIRPVAASFATALRDPRFRAILFTILGLAAVLLAATGLYAVAAFDVRQRQYEMGVRLSIGATGRDIQRMIVAQACRPVVAGLVLGLIGTYWTAAFLQQFLYQIDPREPWLYVTVCGIIVVTAVLAAWLPAWRASRLDPSVVLRAQ
jgi:predicted permease